MLDKANVRKIAYDYSVEVTKALKPDKIVLFGSYVNGDPHNDSDIDIAVFVHGLDDTAWYDARIALQKILWHRDFRSIEPHLLDITRDRSGFAAHIDKTGETIYPL
ncbi:MAG: nucleotidyltransferase domain-containing protein [Oscillospiraceae bacterium]|nr:nucleotidyltransferase domain-containing protein [Oscillospiraceae bacterium]